MEFIFQLGAGWRSSRTTEKKLIFAHQLQVNPWLNLVVHLPSTKIEDYVSAGIEFHKKLFSLSLWCKIRVKQWLLYLKRLDESWQWWQLRFHSWTEQTRHKDGLNPTQMIRRGWRPKQAMEPSGQLGGLKKMNGICVKCISSSK